MKKKGFTLIELLAVIVILAIIAVITVPKIADMISSSREGGAEDSFYGSLKAAEIGYAKALQSKTDLKGDTCDLSKASGDKVTCTNSTVLSFSGKIPEKGIITIANGSVEGTGLTLNGYSCSGDLSTKKPCEKQNSKVLASETLISKVVTSGDGLHSDNYEFGRYIFRGQNPNNYVLFNNEPWRIISVEKDKTLKIIRQEILAQKSFDETKSNNWARPATLNTYLNEEYYNNLSSAAKNQIQSHNFSVGAVSGVDSEASDIPTYISDENAATWTGKIGLMNGSDYLRANLNAEKCGNRNLNNSNDSICKTTNYLYNGYCWLITPVNQVNATSAYFIDSYGSISSYFSNYEVISFRPSLYLKADISLSGKGTTSEPYKIVQ